MCRSFHRFGVCCFSRWTWLLISAVGGLLVFSLAAVGRAQDASNPGIELFEKKIRPVLVKHCYGCHSARAKEVQGELLLDSRAGIRRGGASGPAVVPGKPEESLILGALKHETFEMPPDRRLPDRVVADFRRWIELGAPDPRDGRPKPSANWDQGRDHWAFRPVEPHAPPPVKQSGWARTPVDRFILARLEAQGLSPGRDASDEVLLRRVYFDLWGLPPTVEEVRRFLADRRADRWPRLVDRLLADPRFGQRWGRHWLDVVRYGDSSGGGRSLLFPQAWRFRDYVIRAFNQDKPFDRLVLEHLAGDLLPEQDWRRRQDNLIATAFLVLGPINYELQDKPLLRVEVIDEQLSTVGKAFLGMTLGCARCHNHKFDPIPMRDYYALAGIFHSTKSLVPGNVSGFTTRPLPLSPQQQARWDHYQKRRRELQHQIQETKKQLGQLRQKRARLLGLQPEKAVVVDDDQARLTGPWQRSRGVKPFVGQGYRYSSSPGAQAVYQMQLPPGRYLVQLSYTAHTNRCRRVRVRIRHAQGTAERFLDQRQGNDHPQGFHDLGHFSFTAEAPATVSLQAAGPGVLIADAVRFVPLAAASSPKQEETTAKALARLERQLQQLRQRQKQAESELRHLEQNAPEEPPQVMSVLEQPEPGDWHICLRGDLRRPGPRVPRGFLSVVGSLGITVPEDQSGRLELARWIAHPRNPLTARVYVNRVWQHLLGRGLVATPDNFGTTGQEPTHPELLDYLAAWFVQNGWSTKRLVRLIVLSRVYQLSSDPRQQQARVDPANRLFWRAERKVLEAEALRDAMLYVSGQLDLSLGGPAFPPSLKREFGYRPSSRKRSVYLPVLRNTLPELFQVFDFANPNMVVGRRSRSVLPTQALYLMNSPFVLEQAERAAARLLEEEADPQRRLHRAFVRFLGRPPVEAERKAAEQFLGRRLSVGGDSGREAELWAWTLLCQGLFATLDFRFVH